MTACLPRPWYADELVCLYHGDALELLPALAAEQLWADCMVTDPPYGETDLAWDRWPSGWPHAATLVTESLWCFGSLRMFLTHRDEFRTAGWRLSQDVIWHKQAGSAMHADRFKRVHEHALHWYQGRWAAIYKDPQREPYYGPTRGSRTRRDGPNRIAHIDGIGPHGYTTDGTRLLPSVVRAANLRGRAIHPTEKPAGILDPLIRYACPIDGTVLDPFAGSAATLDVARCAGRRAIGIEADATYCDLASRRLAQGSLFGPTQLAG